MKTGIKKTREMKICLDKMSDTQRRAYTLMLEADRPAMSVGKGYEIEISVLRIVTGDWDGDIESELKELTEKYIRVANRDGQEIETPMLSSVDITCGVMKYAYPVKLITMMRGEGPGPGAAICSTFKSGMKLPLATSPGL